MPGRLVADGRMDAFKVVPTFEVGIEGCEFSDGCRLLPEDEIPLQGAFGALQDTHAALFIDPAAMPGSAQSAAGTL